MNPTNTDDRIDELTADAAQDTTKAWIDALDRTLTEKAGHTKPPSPKTYPSFYAAVHRACTATALGAGCPGKEEPYEPDEHWCYSLAGALRVELHAAGIRLLNDGNGSESSDVADKAMRRLRQRAAEGIVSEDVLRERLAYYEQPPQDGYSYSSRFVEPEPGPSLFDRIRERLRYFGGF